MLTGLVGWGFCFSLALVVSDFGIGEDGGNFSVAVHSVKIQQI